MRRLRIHLLPAAVLALLLAPASAHAHAGLVASTPPPGRGLPQAPGAVVLRFSEPLNHRLSRVEVLDPAGHEVTVGPTMPVEGDPHAMQRKLALLRPGQYTVRWTTVSSLDGHTRRGSHSFGIAAAAFANERVENDPVSSEGWLGLVGRVSAVAGLGLWAGFAVLGPVAIRAGVPERRLVLLGRAGPLLALGGTALSVVGATVVTTGSLDGIGEVLFASRPGRLRAIVLAVSAAALWAGPRRRRVTRLLMALAVLAEAGSGHAASAARPVVAAASFAAHLAAAGVWVFAIVAATLSAERLIPALVAFSPYAVGAAVVVGLSGVANTALELSRPADLWATAYGRTVVAKAGVFLVMAALGQLHRRRRRRPAADASQVARPLHAEFGAAALALVLAAVLVSFPNPPREAQSAEPLTRIDPVLASLHTRDAVSVAAPSGPFVVALTLLPARPGVVEVRLQVVGAEAGDAPRHARVRGESDLGASSETSLAPCERTFACFAGHARLETPGRWRLEASITTNRGPIAVATTLTLPVPDATGELARAIEAMERLRSARLDERLQGAVGGPLMVAGYRFRAPDAFEMQVSERHRIVIGERAFDRPSPSAPWTASPWPGPAFTWPRNYYREFWRDAAAARLLGIEAVDGVPASIVAFVRPELPAWFRLWVGVRDGLVRRHEMLAEGHLMDHTFSRFDEPADIRPPI